MAPKEYEQKLKDSPRKWLITGVAGFIGSNLLETLLLLGQDVVGFDNYSTGHHDNLKAVRAIVGEEAWSRFRMVDGDIRDLETCQAAAASVDYVLHQAALGSGPSSISDPVATHENNVNGFLNMLVAARDAGVMRFVYASSSSVYGDHPALPKVEADIGKPLSPYAATKVFNEVYADVFARCYGLETIGLRYFNVFGRRQDPEGQYAAVIPLWFKALLKGEPVYVNGDGETTRDFCYVDNAVQANLLAAVADKPGAVNRAYNVAYGERNTLNRLFELVGEEVRKRAPGVDLGDPVYRDFRPGDIRHSLADISSAQTLLGYAPEFDLGRGLVAAADYYTGLFSD